MNPARLPDGTERRAAIELRAGGRRLEGVAAPSNTPARIGTFTEVIRPGAFRSTLLDGHDVLALVDHDPTKLLARTGSGSLTLAETARGLTFSIALPDTQLASDVLALAQRGDLGGVSIGFRAADEAWPAKDMRELRAVDLVEISIISAFPAYAGTSIVARSRGRVPPALRLRRLYLEAL
jgi:HK97 family phage prohead protease